MLRSRETAEKPKRMDLEIASTLQKREVGFVAGILKMSEAGELKKTDPRVVMAKDQKDRGKEVTKPLSKNGFLNQFDSELSKQLKRKNLPLHVRGRLEAIRKSSEGMKALNKNGGLDDNAAMLGISKLSERAFNAINADGKLDKKASRGFFGLAAKSSDEISRRSLRKSFERGLVSDVANEKGMKWTDAASKLGALGMIGKNDPRLKVKDKDVMGKLGKSKEDFDKDEVNSGTAATSVMQIGRSLDDATRTLGNRLNSAGDDLRKAKPSSAGEKAQNHFDRGALAEATALASLKAGGSKKEAHSLFSLAGANSNKGLEALVSRKRTKVAGIER